MIKTGKECIDYFERNGRFEKRTLPCLVFLDLVMAPIDGLEVLRLLRDAPYASDSIFVMLSGIGNIKALHEGYQLGALTFLVKPINPEDVVQFVSSARGLKWIQNDEGYVLSLDRQQAEIPKLNSLLQEPADQAQRVVTVSA